MSARPVFLTKAQRELLRAQEEAEEAEKRRGEAQVALEKRRSFEAEAARRREDERRRREDERRSGRGDARDARRGGGAHERFSNRRDDGRREPPRRGDDARGERTGGMTDSYRGGGSHAAPSASGGVRTSSSAAAVPLDPSRALSAEEKRAIREEYLGAEKPRKVKLTKAQVEKNRFVASWSAEEDTSRDRNEIYRERADGRLAFGSGRLAGVDEGEAAKQRAAYARLVAERNAALLREAAAAGGGGEDGQVAPGTDLVVAGPDARIAAAVQRDASGQDGGSVREKRERRRAAAKAANQKHWSQKPLEEMTDRDWRILREDYSIVVRRGRAPKPVRSWDESGLPPELLSAVAAAGYEKPTPIQMQCLPIGLANRDMIGIAETGSGKTAAFVLPMLVYIGKQPRLTPELAGNGPYALVMAPTRELANQISIETIKFARPLGFKSYAVTGGVPMEEQQWALREGCEILIATPGRLVDCLEQRFIVFAQCNYVVLDEADRMIVMGFDEKVQAILDSMPSSNLRPLDDGLVETDRTYRQTFMFSATMPPDVARLAEKYLRSPSIIAIGEVGMATDNVEQRIEWVPESRRRARLLELLSRECKPPIIVFVKQKSHCDPLARALMDAGYRTVTLHSGKTQDQRQASLRAFRNKDADILVATDVASRGIDVPGVQYVINFDMSTKIEEYTHRVGRTGRAGEKGTAITFIDDGDESVMYDLKKMLERSKTEVPRELARHPASFVKPMRR